MLIKLVKYFTISTYQLFSHILLVYEIEFKKTLENSIEKYSTECEVFHFSLLISPFDLLINLMLNN